MTEADSLDLADPTHRARWCREVGAVFRARPVVIGLVPLAAASAWVELLATVGARRPLVLATSRGAGPVPDDDAVEVVYVDPGCHPSMTEELRALDGNARDLPPHARRAVDTYDPERRGVWLVGPFVDDAPIQGRPVYGGRPAAWAALEDKLVAEPVWRAVGHPVTPTRVVPVDGSLLDEASDALDAGDGVVWAGDARDGFNGGGDFTRWVVTAGDRLAAAEFFAERCDRVRVMPFLEGVPCSVHGYVLPDGTAAHRPVELAILRGEGRRFVYGGRGTTWDPPTADREVMRHLVRRVGEHLRTMVGYRGGFGIDGVLSADGFRPTELNSRVPGGLTMLDEQLDKSFFTMLQAACHADLPHGVTVEALEAWALPALDAERTTRVITVTHRRLTEEPVELPVRRAGRRLELAAPGENGDALLQVAPGAVGSFVRVSGELLAPGERVGPLNAALLELLDRELDARVGPVTHAPDVRDGV